MYTYQHKLKLHETDAAGLIFFSRQLEIMHDAYESLLETVGFGFAELIRNQPFFLPIVHIEADYKAPLFVGDLLEIEVRVSHIGETSFTFDYKIYKSDRTLVGTGKTVHVTTDKKTRQKTPIPSLMRTKIKELYSQDK